jgi:hypothetical protein
MLSRRPQGHKDGSGHDRTRLPPQRDQQELPDGSDGCSDVWLRHHFHEHGLDVVGIRVSENRARATQKAGLQQKRKRDLIVWAFLGFLTTVFPPSIIFSFQVHKVAQRLPKPPDKDGQPAAGYLRVDGRHRPDPVIGSDYEHLALPRGAGRFPQQATEMSVFRAPRTPLAADVFSAHRAKMAKL